ncbi:Hsp20/alpha crystallin family protein [Salinadaptatus halalkaliphilus]|uniref:Hsp20/alpha crystallin family protein n=1 Tax=Salinadaptatus halalkaliphilus TaxID=2419781 RepID=A0A4S3TPB2_9EURY|nr:Hsp20 family protein [Salinadaptatus halalkaliphilus]THE66152.1 Hsp20/alpha crystallin family protein [Salinadaptatus halalkaliphilus]
MNFDDLKRSVGDTLYRQIGRANGHLQTYRSLPVDVLENDTSYLVVFDAPGAEPDDVQVRYLEGSVRIRIRRFRQFRDRFELRFPGRGMTLEGEVDLPTDATVDPDAGTAKLTETGTLRIEIPKEGADTGSDSATESVETTDADDSDETPTREPTSTTDSETVTVEE